MNRLKIVLMLVAGVNLFSYSEAAAQSPGAATDLVAREGKSMSLSWPAVDGATWYYLWINDASRTYDGTTRHHRWYTAAELECAVALSDQPLFCKIGLTLDAVPGRTIWWVQTYGDGGFGPWSAAQFYTPGPLSAVISAAGAIYRGNAVSAQRLGVGHYEVDFGRPVSHCIYNVNPGGLELETPAGFASAAQRLFNANAVVVAMRNPANAPADISFHLTVVCGATQ